MNYVTRYTEAIKAIYNRTDASKKQSAQEFWEKTEKLLSRDIEALRNPDYITERIRNILRRNMRNLNFNTEVKIFRFNQFQERYLHSQYMARQLHELGARFSAEFIWHYDDGKKTGELHAIIRNNEDVNEDITADINSGILENSAE